MPLKFGFTFEWSYFRSLAEAGKATQDGESLVEVLGGRLVIRSYSVFRIAMIPV